MLSQNARPLIDASVPVLREHGVAITKHFYQQMFAAHPELLNLFNQGNQASGAQQQSLASALFAYAANWRQPDALAPVISRIVHKHASVGITSGQYTIVGRHLLGAIQHVLGAAATPALMAAWDEAYWLLAGELIAAEARLYDRTGVSPGEMQTLRVMETRRESEDILSFYLQTPAGGSPGVFRPGQYVSVAVEQDGLRQLRQYSLSDAPLRPWWRITVKRELARPEAPAGRVSNWLFDTLRTGDKLLVSAPFGDFQPQLAGERPLVLLSAGVGITPMVSVVNALAADDSARRSSRLVVFAHATRNGAHHALRSDLAGARQYLRGLCELVCYESPRAEDVPGRDYHQAGRLSPADVLNRAGTDADFYLCGPVGFMREQWQGLLAAGVAIQHIHREVFGPDLLDHLL